VQPAAVGIRDSVVQLVSILGGVVSSARAGLGSIRRGTRSRGRRALCCTAVQECGRADTSGLADASMYAAWAVDPLKVVMQPAQFGKYDKAAALLSNCQVRPLRVGLPFPSLGGGAASCVLQGRGRATTPAWAPQRAGVDAWVEWPESYSDESCEATLARLGTTENDP
jgi:hypothetical protein